MTIKNNFCHAKILISQKSYFNGFYLSHNLYHNKIFYNNIPKIGSSIIIFLKFNIFMTENITKMSLFENMRIYILIQ